MCERVTMQMGEARVEYRPRNYGKKVPITELQPQEGSTRGKV